MVGRGGGYFMAGGTGPYSDNSVITARGKVATGTTDRYGHDIDCLAS